MLHKINIKTLCFIHGVFILIIYVKNVYVCSKKLIINKDSIVKNKFLKLQLFYNEKKFI